MKIQSLSLLIFFVFTFNACSMFTKKSSGYAEISETYTNTMPTFVEPEVVEKKTKDDFGVLEITQDGPGYEINLALDTGDENVSFTMDLPEQSSASKQLEEQDQQNTDGSKNTNPLPVQTNEPEVSNDFTQPDPVEEKTQTQIQQQSPAQTSATQKNDTGPSANDYLVSAQTQFYEDNYIGALSDIENAIEKDGNQALSYAIKGSILYKLGNKGAAKIAWEKALELNPKLKSVELSLQYLIGQ